MTKDEFISFVRGIVDTSSDEQYKEIKEALTQLDRLPFSPFPLPYPEPEGWNSDQFPYDPYGGAQWPRDDYMLDICLDPCHHGPTNMVLPVGGMWWTCASCGHRTWVRGMEVWC